MEDNEDTRVKNHILILQFCSPDERESGNWTVIGQEVWNMKVSAGEMLSYSVILCYMLLTQTVHYCTSTQHTVLHYCTILQHIIPFTYNFKFYY